MFVDDGAAVVVVVVEEMVWTLIPDAAFLKSKVPSGGPSGTSGMNPRRGSPP